MQVEIKKVGESLTIRLLEQGGGHAGRRRGVILLPGERFHGWKYSRLVKLGDGIHELIDKQTRARIQ